MAANGTSWPPNMPAIMAFVDANRALLSTKGLGFALQ